MTEPSVIFVDDDPHIRQAIAQTLKLEDLPVAVMKVRRPLSGRSMPTMTALSCVTTICRR